MGTALENYFLLLNGRLDRVREAKSLTLVQFDLIKQKQYDELAENLSARDKIMSEFENLGDELKRVERDVSETTEDKEKSARIVAEINDIMAEIRDKNTQLREMLNRQKEDCKEEIKMLHENERGTMTYINNNTIGGSRYFDREG
jgi:chromosome segregation ATPase